MSDSKTLNVTALQEMGEDVYFRLTSTDPKLPRTLRGKVYSALRLAKMAMYSVMVLKAADQDELAARNEFAMARTSADAAGRTHHMNRGNILRVQAMRRRNASEARLDAILGAVAL